MGRAYRLLLRLLPRDFREEFGEEMAHAVLRRWDDVRSQAGFFGGGIFWLRQAWAVMSTAAELRLQSRRGEHDHREGTMTGGLRHDIRQAVRGFRRRPAFMIITLATLGLGIGASTAVFSAVHTVLLRDLPYADPDRALVVFHRSLETGEREAGLSPSNAVDLDERASSLSEVAVAEPWGADLEVDGRVESLRAWRVSEGFFASVGAEAALGRLFTPDEYLPGGEPVLVLGDRSWRARFGADPAIVGGTVTLEGEVVTVTGILPPDFKLPDEAEFWTPRPPQDYDPQQRTADYMMGVARLTDGATLENARAEVERVARDLARDYPETNATRGFDLVPLREHLFGDVRTPLFVLFGAVGFVLLIACANVAGLMLARGVRRQREYALRKALGATPGRLARQLTVESSMLALGGGVLGIGLAWLGVDVIQGLAVDHLPRIEELRVDGAVLVFAVATAVGSALLAGIVPSLRLSRTDPAGALGDGGRGTTVGRASTRSGRRLVVAEVALAMVLVVGAGLLAKSFAKLLDRELGFQPENRLAVQVFAYGLDGGVAPFIREMDERFLAIPGVNGVALTSTVPGATDGVLAAIDIDLGFTIEDRAAPPVGQEPTASVTQVSTNFFDVMEMRVLDGRGFDDFDRADAEPVIVVNETLARRHFGDGSAVGERLVIGYQPVAREIVGVVADVRTRGHESDPRPEVYFPIEQFSTASLTFVLRTDGEAASLANQAREAVWEIRPSLAVWGTATVEELLGTWLKERRFNLLLLGAFAAVALVLATIGVYGLVSFGVEQRVSELGIRRVLGGEDSRILRMIVGESLRLTGTGVGLGAIGALLTTRFLGAMLFGIEPTDPLTFVGVAAVVLLAAALASLVPAVRAVRSDPMAAVRGD